MLSETPGGENVISKLFQEIHNDIFALASELCGIFDTLKIDDEFRLKMRLYQEQLKDLPPLSFVVVGATKAGKSTLVNAMLSRPNWRSSDDFYEVLPRRLLAETNAFWRVESSDNTTFEFSYGDDVREFENFEEISQYISENHERSTILPNSLVTIKVPQLFTSIRDNRFCIIDCPGLSEAGFPPKVHEFLSNTPHVMIYVLPITAGCLTTIDDSFLSEIFSIPSTNKACSCVFVLSCFDRAVLEANLKEARHTVEILSKTLDDTFGSMSFPMSCLALQKGTHSNEFTVNNAIEQLDEFLGYLESEFIRVGRVSVLRSILSNIQDTANKAYTSCLSIHQERQQILREQKLEELFRVIEDHKEGLARRFRECLVETLLPPENPSPKFINGSPISKAKRNSQASPPASPNLRDFIENEVISCSPTLSPSFIPSAIFRKDFWSRDTCCVQILEHLRPRLKNYIVMALQDVLRSTCLSFMQVSRAEISEHSKQYLDSPTASELADVLDNVASPAASPNAAWKLVNVLTSGNQSMLNLAATAVGELAAQETSKSLYVALKNRQLAAQNIATTISEAVANKSPDFYIATQDIVRGMLENLNTSIREGVKEYYRTVTANAVHRQHPELATLYETIQKASIITSRLLKIERGSRIFTRGSEIY
eukprot:NODE_1091_length_2135_cov_48.392147_g924_i0.p1 GENE.NODE_1091_length_2135_cov_48.392147_g924_i0~~NODE_1091_length_2135_cov_48.392147_g924_i0.p1  ORF type:complete len:655 (+),score=96.09 NODE_1091_length_2135_cov_48.392147_g924_i0:44-2008(+)